MICPSRTFLLGICVCVMAFTLERVCVGMLSKVGFWKREGNSLQSSIGKNLVKNFQKEYNSDFCGECFHPKSGIIVLPE